ncbi:protein canopy 4 isoform X2 [Hydra vulgaris]|uniref:Protein canopy 4 isoform X2 n=1 Tax=Hydra vulgaris TaxID=6087 RepID=A0ABM4CWW7_HYDVU
MSLLNIFNITFIALLFYVQFSISKKTANRKDIENKINEITKALNINSTKNSTDGEKKKHPKIEEYSRNAHLRPTKCQVCRVLSEELLIEVQRSSSNNQELWLTNRLDGEDNDDEKKGKKISYKTSELRLMDILDRVCNNVYDYRSIAGPDFPYIKGVKSMFRQHLEDMMGQHKLSVKLDAPEELVEDPTYELRRMQYKCNQMIEEFEDDIYDWYLKNQSENPLEFICADKVLTSKEQDCLYASTEVPDFATQPKPIDKDESTKQNFHRGANLEL